VKPAPLLLAVGVAALMLAAYAAPFTVGVSGWGVIGPAGLAVTALALVAALYGRVAGASALAVLGLIGAFLAVAALAPLGAPGAWGYWALLWGHLFMSVLAVGRIGLSERADGRGKHLHALLPPAAVPFLGLLVWEGLVVGHRVPRAIFPRVTDVWQAILSSWPVLLNDAYVTFVKQVLVGFSLGLVAGVLVGVAVAASPFLRQGLLPLAAAFGAVPIVGLAPVLGRAFGVDWESKAAVVVIITFFPVVLNTVQGLTQVDPLKLELLRAYAAGPREVFLKLRLPSALPYLFNALKLAAVLSVISVIVAEFLIPGPPTGLGQRISLSARRGAYDVVFAAIFFASVVSVLFYSLVMTLERRLTSWHASFREGG
jgi:NitT/TauT family transport system permease protein